MTVALLRSHALQLCTCRGNKFGLRLVTEHMLPAHDSAHGSARCTTENLGDQQQKLGIIKLTYFLFADASPCKVSITTLIMNVAFIYLTIFSPRALRCRMCEAVTFVECKDGTTCLEHISVSKLPVIRNSLLRDHSASAVIMASLSNPVA